MGLTHLPASRLRRSRLESSQERHIGSSPGINFIKLILDALLGMDSHFLQDSTKFLNILGT
jgi:hypothetical protein